MHHVSCTDMCFDKRQLHWISKGSQSTVRYQEIEEIPVCQCENHLCVKNHTTYPLTNAEMSSSEHQTIDNMYFSGQYSRIALSYIDKGLLNSAYQEIIVI